MTMKCPHCGRELGDIAGPGVTGKQQTSREAAEVDRFTDRHWVLWVMRLGVSLTADAVTLHLGDRWSANQTGARFDRILDYRLAQVRAELAAHADGQRLTAEFDALASQPAEALR